MWRSGRTRRLSAVGIAVVVVGAVQPGTARPHGLRRALWRRFAGVPEGRLGRVGAAVLARRHGFFRAMADELALEPGDELLDLGCGAGGLLSEQAAHVRYVAGIDVAEIPVRMARRALADRIAEGTAEVVRGDGEHLPWPDGRFTAVASLDCVKFLPDPGRAFREMFRVLRPGGRAVVGLGDRVPARLSGTVDAWGQWRWSDEDARRLMAEAGFVDVRASYLHAGPKDGLVVGTRPLAAAA